MYSKLNFLIIFTAVVLGGLFLSTHKAAASATCTSAYPTSTVTYSATGTMRVYATGVSGASSVQFATWNTNNGQNDIVWYPATNAGGGTWYADVNIANHTADGYGYIASHAYMWGDPNFCGDAGFTYTSPPQPSCSSATPDGDAVYDNTSVRFYANGVSNATSVLFYTWSAYNGQDDIIANWATNAGGGTWYLDVPMSSHPGDGTVYTHVYMYNAYYSGVWCDQASVTQYAPLAASISASPTSVSYGASSTLSWSSTSASTCGVGYYGQSGSGAGPTPPGGTGGTSGSWAATGLTGPGTVSYFVSCNGVAGGNVGAVATITVGGPPPTCSSATPDGTAVYDNTSVRFYANGVSNATSVLFYTWSAYNGQDDVVANWATNAGGGTWYLDVPMSSHPGDGTVYTHVYMYNSYYSGVWCDQASVTQYAPLAVSISASPTTVGYNNASTITWSSTSASTCTIAPTGWSALSGSQNTGALTSTTTYSLSCNGVAGGNTGATATVTVTTQQAYGYLDTNAGSSNNNGNCTTMGGWAWDPDFPNSAIQVHIYNNGSFYTAITAGDYRSDLPGNHYHGFTFTVPSAWKDGYAHNVAFYAIDLNGGGNPLLGNTPVTAFACVPPTVDLKANGSDGPISINYNTGATLSWTSANATSCILYVNNANTGWSGTSQSSVPTGNMTSPNTYRVDCTGSAGTASDSVQININPQPTCTSATPDGDWIATTSGSRATYANGVANATSVLFATWSETNGQDDIVWYSGANQGGGVWSVNIPLSSHTDTGTINVHVYMYNANYTSGTWCDSASFTRYGSGNININVQDDAGSPFNASWTLTCPLTNPSCPVYTGTNTSSGSYTGAPYSNWTLTPGNIPGYTATVSPSATQTLPSP